MLRPSWDLYFMFLAHVVSTRATCARASVGCVIVDTTKHYVLATGYNGVAAGEPHCPGERLQGLCMKGGHCARSYHAEHNALICAEQTGVDVKGSTAYITHLPCVDCVGLMINAGVSRVVFARLYRPNPQALAYLSEHKISVAHYDSVPQFLIRGLNRVLLGLTFVERVMQKARGLLK